MSDNYIHLGGKYKNNWKQNLNTSDDIINNNYKSHGPGSIQITAPTNSRPQTNLPKNYKLSKEEQINNERAPRGVASVLNYSNSNNDRTSIIGRYNGIYTSARGKRGPLNPIKHWRKQLMPSQGHITGKPSLNQIMWSPGVTNNLVSSDTSCCNIANKSILIEYLSNKYYDNKNCNCNNNINEDNIIRNKLSNFQPVILNNPARIKMPRSSQTLLKKNYYTTSSAYLKSRVKLYNQNQLLSKKEDNTLTMNNGKNINNKESPSSNNWVYAIDNISKGSQVFNSTNCINDISLCCNLTKNNSKNCDVSIIFKPNNPFYSVQGAVDSSTRIQQIKYNAIIKNNYNFSKNNWNKDESELYMNLIDNNEEKGLSGATPIKYRGESYGNVAPYFIKSKYQKINACYQTIFNNKISVHNRAKLNGIGNREPSGGSGKLTTCFYNK